jgi:hypothetical protein
VHGWQLRELLDQPLKVSLALGSAAVTVTTTSFGASPGGEPS